MYQFDEGSLAVDDSQIDHDWRALESKQDTLERLLRGEFYDGDGPTVAATLQLAVRQLALNRARRFLSSR